jgi:putative DNA primase/helicase
MREALKGFDFKRGLEVLVEAGALKAEANGERSRPCRIDGVQRRLYSIRADKLET